jgi:hypothetical protein
MDRPLLSFKLNCHVGPRQGKINWNNAHNLNEILVRCNMKLPTARVRCHTARQDYTGWSFQNSNAQFISYWIRKYKCALNGRAGSVSDPALFISLAETLKFNKCKSNSMRLKTSRNLCPRLIQISADDVRVHCQVTVRSTHAQFLQMPYFTEWHSPDKLCLSCCFNSSP